ncbi:putative Ig domain-containing protein [Methylovulum psychrotolerans]|uniref:Ig domain-containing protein n=1 Tax=Methylovulum psychrotolerans TaxID=1704499 RepID=UPI001BFF0D75|nr:Ig domain-containing protein [Methylovulum psychrotolerans]MBT9099509.1 putative Ig domain-containing protein [Methylovulum psychrotolerans]
MKKLLPLLCLYALSPMAQASTAYGSLSNFDAVNDTGEDTHGFEIEIDDVHSTQIQYTYDWNHYGHPTITEDNSDPAHPKTFVRYESKKDAAGNYLSYTAMPAGPFPPTQGHQCTNPAVNIGCEHFGVSYSAPGIIKYHWLIDNPSAPGNLVLGPEVLMSAPSWTYQPPVAAQPAKVVAVIPAPPVPPVKEFGVPSWVKVIKTQLHSNIKLPLDDLSSADKNGDGKADWTNGEKAQVETEWYLLQAQTNGLNKAKLQLPGAAEPLNNGDEQITRRYEFYKYAGEPLSLDGETDEAMCDVVAKDGLHGVGKVDVTDASGNSYTYTCSTDVVVGDYTGAQMVGFDVAAPLGLIEHIEDGKINVAYTKRTVVAGGNTPYVTTVSGGALPQGLAIDSGTGVLSGKPTEAGVFTFTVNATDADNAVINKNYTISIINPLALLPVISTTVLPAATEGAAYSSQLTATGGLPPYTWTATALPAGLQLSASGLLSGTPAVGSAGANIATYTVTDQAAKTDSKALTLTISSVGNPACSQTDAPIKSIGRKFLVINSGLLASDHVWYTPTPAGTTFTGGTTTFLTGELVTFSGTLDGIGACHATTMVVKPKPNYSVADAGHAKISAFGSNYIMVGAKKIIWNSKTAYLLNAPAIQVGMKAVWRGKLDTASNTVLATKLTIN